MKKNIHVHLHEAAPASARTADSDGEGRWVTISGTHVQIKDGKITAGPKGAVGKSVQEGFDHLASKTDERSKGGGPKGTVKVTVRPGSNVRGAHHADEGHYHMSSGLAAHHAEKGDVMHHSETRKGKEEAHRAKADEHTAQAHEFNAGGSKEASGSHVHAARMHNRAANHYALNDPGSEQAAAEAHKLSEALGQGKLAQNADKPHVTTIKPMPGSHVALHEQADKDVKGSKKHEAEHNRLQNMYHSSNADWERQAVNRKIERNATEAKQANADHLHGVALKASDFASEHGDAAAHKIASQRLQSAIDAHGRAGGVGYAAKQAELAKRKKEHDAETGGPSLVKQEAQKDAATHHRAQAAAHRKPAGELAKPDHKMADLHDEKAAHHEAQAKGEDRSAQIKDLAGKIAQHQSDVMKPKGAEHAIGDHVEVEGTSVKGPVTHVRHDINGEEPPKYKVGGKYYNASGVKKAAASSTPALSKMEAAVAKRKALEANPNAPMPKRGTPVAGNQQDDFQKAKAASAEKLKGVHQGARMKFTRALTGEDAEGAYSGIDDQGRVLVTVSGRVHALPADKVSLAYPKK